MERIDRETMLKSIEDIKDLRLADQRLADLRAGQTRAIPLENVTKAYGLAD